MTALASNKMEQRSRPPWATRISDRLRTVLGIGAIVVPVRQSTFERSEFKAKRVIDDRDMLQQMRRHVESRASS